MWRRSGTLVVNAHTIGNENVRAAVQNFKMWPIDSLHVSTDGSGTVSADVLDQLRAQSNAVLKRVTFWDVGVNVDVAQLLSQFLTQENTLRQLHLDHCTILDAAAARTLLDACARSVTLTELLWSHYKITDAADIVTRGTHLKQVRFSRAIGDDGVTVMSHALANNATLESLGLHDNLITDQGAPAFARALRANQTLTNLDLSHNSIECAGARQLAAVLAQNTTLKKLDLSSNAIGADGARALAAALVRNATLTTLWLCGNSIGDRGACHFAKVIARNGTLTDLLLHHTQMSSECWQMLTNVLARRNTTLTDFTGYPTPARACARNQTLRKQRQEHTLRIGHAYFLALRLHGSALIPAHIQRDVHMSMRMIFSKILE